MEGKLKVTTEMLKAKGGEWEGLAGRTEALLIQTKEEMERMKNCFDSEAVTMLQKAFCQQAQAGMKQTGAVKEHMEKLAYIAAGYEEAESANEAVIPEN